MVELDEGNSSLSRKCTHSYEEGSHDAAILW
jgi:hypothetical protein